MVVEFDDDDDGNGCNGGLGLVRDEWITPRKKESFWPPYKLSSQYNRSLAEGHQPDEKWKLFPIRKIFYSSGS